MCAKNHSRRMYAIIATWLDDTQVLRIQIITWIIRIYIAYSFS